MCIDMVCYRPQVTPGISHNALYLFSSPGSMTVIQSAVRRWEGQQRAWIEEGWEFKLSVSF